MIADSGKDKHNIRDWWAQNPMTYGETHGQTDFLQTDEHIRLGTPDFFQKVDQIFYARYPQLHSAEGNFSELFPYQRYRGKAVLEVGCGMGTMAMNWALQGASVTAVDLNPTSIEQTHRRFELMGLTGTINLADGNELPFEDESFDYAYSWGVLHHSPNLNRSLRELVRVLRRGGEFGLMLYNRDSVLYRHSITFLEGFLHGESIFLDEAALASRYTDGAREEGNPHTWPVTKQEILKMLSPVATDLRVRKLGTDLDAALEMMIPLPKVNRWFPRGWKKALARRWGWSLWVTGSKP